jgi:integrase
LSLATVQPHEARAITVEEVTWLIEAARPFGLADYLLFAAGTGCRRGEVLAITWGDIDRENRSARISKSLELNDALCSAKVLSNCLSN